MNSQLPLAAESGGSVSGMSVSSHGESPLQPAGPLAATTMPPKKKKPGPKRDSKPAPSEKLERNRQAQRTHRERKEQYTKDLELEVMRLKELFAQASRERDGAIQSRDAAFVERDQLREENLRLREYVQQSQQGRSSVASGADSGYESMSWTGCDSGSSIAFSDISGQNLTANAVVQDVADSRRPSSVPLWEMAETRGFASDGVPPPMTTDLSTINVESTIQREDSGRVLAKLTTELPAIQLDYDELGLDFVLTLERPCMNHIQYLHVRAHNSIASTDGSLPDPPMEVPDDGENQHISGHALMATAPLYTDIMSHPSKRYTCQMPQIPNRKDLINLLNLSAELEVLEPELPPVRAWVKMMQDERVRGFGPGDFEVLKTSLLGKIHCYRFGAVIDEHDIDDAIMQVCRAKEAAAVAAAAPSASVKQLEP